MKLDAFRFRHVGPFGANGVAVSGLEPGLNVVAEHNERGKSSLLAALEMVLFLPHTSWKGEAKRLQRESGAPMGEVDFTHDGQPYRLRKRFVKSRQAELLDRTSGAVLATKREAEERLGAMLGFDAASHGPSGLLWVRQGDSLERAADDGQVASRLESELSTLVGGERARAYLDRAEAELGELLTRTGRVRSGGPLARAEDAHATTQSALETAQAAQAATWQMGEDLTRTRARIAATQAQGDPDAEAQALKDAHAALEYARIARSELDAKRDRLRRLELELDGATTRLATHMQAVSTLDTAQTDIAALSAQKEALLTRKTEAEGQLATLDAHLTALDADRAALMQLERLRATQERLGQRNAALQTVTANLEALETEIVRRAERVAARDALPAIGRDTLERMERLQRTVEHAEDELARLDVALILDLQPGVVAKLGTQAVGNGPMRLNAQQTLSLDGVGTIRLDAPEADDIRARQADARNALQALHDPFGTVSLEEARRHMRKRQAIGDDIALIDRLIAQIAPDGRDALIEARERLNADVAQLGDLLQDAPDTGEMLDAAKLETDLAMRRGQQAAARTARSEADVALAKVETQIAALQRQTAAAPDTARPDARNAVQAELSATTATLSARIETARAELDDAQAQAPTDPALIEARIRRLSEVGQNRAQTLSELRMREAELIARRRESFDQRDPDAEVTRLEERLEALRKDVARHRRRANALSLLRDTLRESQSALQARYTEPVRRELLPLLRQVIDGADVALDETLGAQGLSRGGADDALERLSGGTREQIAVLTRLAFARLLARGGQPCPVILDDALVYADDARRGRMFDVLNYVTGGDDPLQLIYLSCHEANSVQLGGHRLRLETWPEDREA